MRLNKQKGFAIITLIFAMVLMAVLSVGIYTLTTSSSLSELLSGRDYNAYQLAKAGLRYAAFNGDASVGSYCMSGGCFTIAIDTTNTDPTVKRYTSNGYVNVGALLAANRQLAYNMPNSAAGGPGTISFKNDIGDITQPTAGWEMNKPGAVTVDYTNKQILLGDGTVNTTDAFGSVVYRGGSYLGNCTGGICEFGAGIHAYFEFTFFPEDSSANSTASADGFTFAIFNGTNNLISATGGPPPDISSLGELVGYAGPGTQGPGWQPPKLAIEFDSYPNTNSNSITVPGSRRDPAPFSDHMALILWGENSAAPYRPDEYLEDAVGLRCAPNDEFVRSLYRSILGRRAELGATPSDGLRGWTSSLNTQTTTAAQNAVRSNSFGGFFDSGEYKSGIGKTDTQYLTDVFQAVLGLNPQYTNCAPENGSCTFAGRKTVRYGANGSYFYKYDQISPVACTNANFGDPISGIAKQCQYTDTPIFTDGYWTDCAPENGSCTFADPPPQKIVRYGANGSYFYKYDQTSPVACTNANFGDPIPGTVKRCSTLDRTAFLNTVLLSTAYTNNVASCGTYTYNAAANMGAYDCGGGVNHRPGTALDCSGLPLSLYNRDTLDDNVHSEGLTESSFTALPLSPRNSDRTPDNGTGYYEGPDRQCKSSGATCRWFEDGYVHKVRIEVIRDTAAHICSRDYTGNGGAAAGNCYNYRVKAWMDCDGQNPTGCTVAQLNNMGNVTVAFTDTNPQIDRIIELTEYRHLQFNTMIFGWTGATGQPQGGIGQKVTLSNFEMAFRTPRACPAVASITPASLPDGAVGVAYSQTLAAAPLSAKPFTWFVINGSLPAGLGLSPGGVISGTPTAGGTSNFTVRATNTCGATLTKAYSITVPAIPFTCTGGTITTSGGKTIHTFTSVGTSSLVCTGGSGPVSADTSTIGGGGRGADMSTSGTYGSGGGGGGAYASGTVTISAATYSVYVGAGSTTGSPGEDSWFGSTATVMAKGGNTCATDARPGAVGGQASGSVGTTKYNGGTGGTGSSTVTTSGGGGGGAGSTGAGGNGGAPAAGTGTSLYGGNGGAGRTNAGIGNPGSNYGGGGGAGCKGTGSATRVGGAGASGVVIVSY
jgi:hypothetical protein